MFPRTYEGDAATLAIALLKAQKDLFESDVLESVPIRELVDKDVVIELVNGRDLMQSSIFSTMMDLLMIRI